MSENDEVIEQVTEAATVEKSEESAPPVEDSPKSTEENESKDVEKPAEKLLTQKEVDEAIQRRLSRESRKLERQIRAEVENKYLRQQIESQTAQKETQQPSGEPKPEQFKTYEDYIKATAKWEVKQEYENARAKEAEVKRIAEQQSYEEEAGENLRKGIDKYDDYEEVVESIPANYVTGPMVQAIAESGTPAEIAYYLGNNHKEAAEIAKLSPVQQVKAIDRLEAKLKAPQKVSEAPAPAQTVGKGKATQQIDLNSASLDDYMKMRQKQGARWANH